MADITEITTETTEATETTGAAKSRGLLKTGLIGAAIAGVCCFTPILVIGLGAFGLSAWLGWLDYVLLPALAIFLAITGYALVRRWRRAS